MSLFLNKIIRFFSVHIFCSLIACFILISCQDKKEIDFSSQIKPIINDKCIACHGGVKQNAGFSFLFEQQALGNTDEGTPAIIPGNANKSRLIQRLHETDPEFRMPYQKPALSEEEISLFTDWINQGAKWGTHWAYIPPKKVKLPKVNGEFNKLGFLSNPIDYFIAKSMEEKKLLPNKKANKNLIARRVAFDITGLPPEENLFNQFINEKITYENYIDSLLSKLTYGEKWSSWWLDFARYADTKGYEADLGRTIWKYRDWVIQAFNRDLPYDKFTIEQLAGDLLPNPSYDQLLATAFHRNTMNNDEGGTDNEEFRVAAVIDRVNTTFDVWQSTTMSCVQCHDHPYDPIKQKEYYQLMTFFNNTKDEDIYSEVPTLRSYSKENNKKIDKVLNWISKNGDKKIYGLFKNFILYNEPVYYSHNFKVINTDYGFINQGLRLRNKGKAIYKNIYTNGYDNLYFGHSFIKHKTSVILRKNSFNGEIIGKYYAGDNLDYNSDGKFEKNKYIKIKIKRQIEPFDLYIEVNNKSLKSVLKNGYYQYDDVAVKLDWIAFLPNIPGANKKGYKDIKKSLNKILNNPESYTPIMVENEDYMKRKTHLFDRGSWLNKKQEVNPGVPASLNKWDREWMKNRLGFAKWLISKDNPLTSRTLVNRVWYQLFGKGLVQTIEDLGTQSDPPTHPALLDWLAYDFMNSMNWSIKTLLKNILLSSTYRQSSIIDEKKYKIDPENLFYSRGPKLRLSAEEIRDQALYVSGLLSDKMYGAGVMPPQPEGIWEHPYNGNLWKESKNEDKYRRGIYTYLKRTSPYPSLMTFDAGSREVCLVRRSPSNTPLQALVTMNDPVYLEAAFNLAYLNKDKSVENGIKQMYYKANYREIDNQSLNLLLELYKSALSDYEQNPKKLINFYDQNRKTDKKLASLAIVASAIMNLDEFLTHG